MRLIDADELIDDLMERYCKECDKRKGIKNGKYRIIYEIGEAPCRACEVDDVKAELEDAPTADVPDRKVGRWIYYPKARGSVKSTAVHLYPVCSECGCEHPVTNYCPNCGAEMKGEKNE